MQYKAKYNNISSNIICIGTEQERKDVLYECSYKKSKYVAN